MTLVIMGNKTYNFIENRIPNRQSSFSLNKVFQNCFEGGMYSVLHEANSMLYLQSRYTEGQNSSLFNFQIHSGQWSVQTGKQIWNDTMTDVF